MATISWTPNQISSKLAAWWDFSDASTVTTVGSKISQVNDKSGNNRNATQTNDSLRFGAGSRSLSGLTMADASDTHYMNCSVPATEQHDVFVVLILDDLTGSTILGNSTNAVYLRPVYSSVYQSFAMKVGGNTTYYTFSQYDNLEEGYPSVVIPTNQGLLLDFYYGVRATRYASVMVYGKDLVGNYSAISGTGFQGTWKKLASDFDGAIGEVVITNQVLDDPNRILMEGYLANKWGIQGYLDESHLYYSGEPELIVPECRFRRAITS